MQVIQTACRHCGLDIEGVTPFERGEWRDRGNNTHCNGSMRRHEPPIGTVKRCRACKGVLPSRGDKPGEGWNEDCPVCVRAAGIDLRRVAAHQQIEVIAGELARMSRRLQSAVRALKVANRQ